MTNPESNNDKKQVANFAKNIGIAFQMLATIGVLSFIGYKIDQNRNDGQFIFTAIFGIIGVALSLISVIRSLNKNAKD